MNAAPLRWAGRFTRGWVRAYTTGLPRPIGQDRRDEIASDLWEHAADAGASGAGARTTAAQIFGRAVLGMPADLSWHLGELKGDTMTTMPQRLTVIVFGLFGFLSLLMGVGMVVGLTHGNWDVSSDSALFSGLLFAGTIAGLIGPLVALVGVYALRRAQADGAPLTIPRGLLIVGTGGIAFFGAAVWWSIVGPIIAVAILAFWAVQIARWRGEPPDPR
ncbi:MAG: hypothetical protein O6913_03230 [Chloroflexi bacterium]|nr:hypothetical protein [Chloroflexota bacterium]